MSTVNIRYFMYFRDTYSNIMHQQNNKTRGGVLTNVQIAIIRQDCKIIGFQEVCNV